MKHIDAPGDRAEAIETMAQSLIAHFGDGASDMARRQVEFASDMLARQIWIDIVAYLGDD